MSEPTEQLAPTPRTDVFSQIPRGLGVGYYDALDFARQLERDLAEANEAVRRGDYENSLLVADLSTERAAREVIEKALREIEIACGNPDPSDGEGIDPQDVVGTVQATIHRLQKDKERLDRLDKSRASVLWQSSYDSEGAEHHICLVGFRSGKNIREAIDAAMKS